MGQTGSVQPTGVHHVSINVSDVDAATRFYVDVLGLTERDDRPDFGFGGAWLDAGSQQVHLIEADVPTGLGQHFALRVADLAAAVADLRSCDVPVSDPSPVGTSLQAFVTDPSGNLVELHQPG
jgi:glyoxylase I family protein